MLRSGNATAAADACERALAAFPADGNFLCLAARANIVLKQFAKARTQIEAALEHHPQFPLAHDALGDLLLVSGAAADACSAYERALELDPGLSQTREKCTRAQAAASAMPRELRRRRAGRFIADLAEAEAFEQAGERDKAEATYRRILRTDPDNVDAARLLASIAVEHERYEEAEVFLKKAVAVAPDFTRAWVDLSNVQRHLDDYDEAIKSAERVLELSPDTAESYVVHGSAVGVAGQHEAAIESFRRALERDPNRKSALCAMAHHLKTLGRQQEAVERYRECTVLDPCHGEAWWSLANLKTFRFRDDEVETMLGQLANATLDDEARLQIHNALGLEFESRGDYERAFDNFVACNRLRRQAESYDPVDTEMTHDKVIELFDRHFVTQPAADDVDPVPIFVVGLPRSGSTLIEQILASHSQVEGTFELSDLSKVVRDLRRGPRRDLRYPEVVADLNRQGWARLGRAYLARTAKHRSGAAYFVDKNPNNYVFTGLIRRAMPNAKVINARRHPLDSCLGTYKQLFASGQPFSYDLLELGEYYLQYQRLMEHWHTVLPDFVLDVHYESVVADLEGQVRRLLDFCGLPFEEGCLRFHETERPVKTASSEQVRRPLYSSSVDLWRHYEPWIGELVSVLEPVLERLPSASHPPSGTGKGTDQ